MVRNENEAEIWKCGGRLAGGRARGRGNPLRDISRLSHALSLFPSSLLLSSLRLFCVLFSSLLFCFILLSCYVLISPLSLSSVFCFLFFFLIFLSFCRFFFLFSPLFSQSTLLFPFFLLFPSLSSHPLLSIPFVFSLFFIPSLTSAYLSSLIRCLGQFPLSVHVREVTNTVIYTRALH